MNYKASLKKIVIRILILFIVMLILCLAIKIIYKNQALTKSSTENAFYVIDGDTLELSTGEKIRLICVNTPEENQEGYEEAKNFLSSTLLEKEISIKREGIDKYNRTLAWIIMDNDILLNKEIIDEGFGTLFEYNNTNCERIK